MIHDVLVSHEHLVSHVEGNVVATPDVVLVMDLDRSF